MCVFLNTRIYIYIHNNFNQLLIVYYPEFMNSQFSIMILDSGKNCQQYSTCASKIYSTLRIIVKKAKYKFSIILIYTKIHYDISLISKAYVSMSILGIVLIGRQIYKKKENPKFNHYPVCTLRFKFFTSLGSDK